MKSDSNRPRRSASPSSTTRNLHRQVHLEPGCEGDGAPVRGHGDAIGLVRAVLSWLMRLPARPSRGASASFTEHLPQFVSMHGNDHVIYLLKALFLGGFGNYLIPLMSGPANMVFPYVNMVSYWL